MSLVSFKNVGARESGIIYCTPLANDNQVRRIVRGVATQPTELISSLGIINEKSDGSNCCDHFVDILTNCWKQVKSFLMKIWLFFPQAEKTKTISICLDEFPQGIYDKNKLCAYQFLTNGLKPADVVQCTKKKLGEDTVEAMRKQPLFTKAQISVKSCPGVFSYDASTPLTKHWTVNFADTNLFGFCEGPLLAQDELQVLEHPGLFHLKKALEEQPKFNSIGPGEAFLVENINRLGKLDTASKNAQGFSLYGNYFSSATSQEVLSRLTRLPPSPSHIVAMAAPRIPDYLFGKPYQKKHLEELFFTALAAFTAAKERTPGSSKTVIHTGNWGAGAFGNDPKASALMQLAAARCAGVDEVRYYPLEQTAAFSEARRILDKIEKENKTHPLTIDQFLAHVTDNASNYGLLYGKSNGT